MGRRWGGMKVEDGRRGFIEVGFLEREFEGRRNKVVGRFKRIVFSGRIRKGTGEGRLNRRWFRIVGRYTG